MSLVNVLLIGDIVGSPGRRAMELFLPKLIAEKQIDFTIANGENASGGLGITPPVAQELFDLGVDVITTGNHALKHHEIRPFLAQEERLLRPANFPNSTPGSGLAILQGGKHLFGVANLQGVIFMEEALVNPFRMVDEIIAELRRTTPLIFLDFHAEATSEKTAMGYYLDGRVTAVVGTHTHVQTADGRILPKGTAYLTDLGMTGPADSVIGVTVSRAVERFTTESKQRFTTAKGPARLDCCVVTAEAESGLARSIQTFQFFEG